MKPFGPKSLPCRIRVESGILKKVGSLLSPPGGGARRFLWLCDPPDTAPAPSALLKSLAKAGQTIARLPDEEFPDHPTDVDALLITGDAEKIGSAIRFADDCYPGLPYVLVPTTLEAQLGFAFGEGPGLVLCDPSLPVSDADNKRGLIDLIRYAVGFDRLLFDLLYTDFDRASVIRRCLAVRCDLLDAGKTDLYDRLGAPLGDAVKRALANAGSNDLDDADALAIGLVTATRHALKTGFCRQDFLSDLVGLLSYRGLPNSVLISDAELIAAAKEIAREDGSLPLSLPRRLGECGLVTVSPNDLVGLLPS